MVVLVYLIVINFSSKLNVKPLHNIHMKKGINLTLSFSFGLPQSNCLLLKTVPNIRKNDHKYVFMLWAVCDFTSRNKKNVELSASKPRQKDILVFEDSYISFSIYFKLLINIFQPSVWASCYFSAFRIWVLQGDYFLRVRCGFYERKWWCFVFIRSYRGECQKKRRTKEKIMEQEYT